jgi:hypothetical protein
MDDYNEVETVESLQAAYGRLFTPRAAAEESDASSLAQPYPSRYVPSTTTDSTNVDPSHL